MYGGGLQLRGVFTGRRIKGQSDCASECGNSDTSADHLRESPLRKYAWIRNGAFGLKFILTNIIGIDYSHTYTKGVDEEEYILPLKREGGCRVYYRPMLKGCLKEGGWKVASEPEDQEPAIRRK